MKTKDFLTTYKKVLYLVSVFVILLISCLALETFTAGGPNLKNDFFLQKHLLIITLYSIGVMVVIIIPIAFYKVYNEHLVSGADDEADYTLMAQIAISVLATTLSLFLIALLVDHFTNPNPPHKVYGLVLYTCKVIYKGAAVLLIVTGVSMLVIKSFKSGVAPGVTSALKSSWAVIGLAFVCSILLLATCNRNGSGINTNVADPFDYESTDITKERTAVNPALTDWGTGANNNTTTPITSAEQDLINNSNVK